MVKIACPATEKSGLNRYDGATSKDGPEASAALTANVILRASPIASKERTT